MNASATLPGKQQGMALVMGLMILLVMTLISVSAMRSTLMQERMAGGFQGQQVAFQAAEAALSAAKEELEGMSRADFGTGGFYLRGDGSHGPPPAWSEPDAAIAADGFETYSDAVSSKAARDPRFVVVDLLAKCTQGSIGAGGKKVPQAYRIMARGFGTNENQQTVLESYYCR